MNKILILMCYYNRPNLVRFALNSVKNQNYKNWEIVFVDDGSNISAKDSIEHFFYDEMHKIKYIDTCMSTEDKKNCGGSIFGLYWTHACISSDANIAIMLCDDDGLTPGYLNNLNQYFINNPKENWCYSEYIAYDPYSQNNFEQIKAIYKSGWLGNRINPDSRADASQVAFKTHLFKNNTVEFGYPMTANLDSDLYRKLIPFFGLCPYSGLTSQFKGRSENRLENRQILNTHYINNIDINFKPF